MRISSFRVSNYKSFLDSSELVLTDGFNVIIGQNNVGKTALLEAISLTFSNKAHKSLLSLPLETSITDPISVAQVAFTVTGEEVREILLAKSDDFHVPIPADTQHPNPNQAVEVLESILKTPQIEFLFAFNGYSQWSSIRVPTFGLFRSQYDSQSKNGDYYLLRTRQNKSGFDAISNLRTGPDNLEFGFHLAEILRGRIYSFRAERLNVGTCPLGQNETLQNDASNLPEVLNVLQGNPERFREFNRLVSRIFPNIYWISVAPAGNALKILIWTEDPKHSRKDLAIDLAESGTGVGQVLAMLYVAINSKFSIPIIIDEPNSFLHPGAARKLIETLKEFPRHQYIISTHSPEIVGATNPKTLSLLRWEKPQTKVQAMNASEVTELRECLLEVGVKLSDIFGADQILWVEGDTEEECFPELVRGSTDAVGTSIVGVRNTGDFETRRMSAEAIVDVYKKLSGAEATLPPTIAFVFDREGRSQDEMDQLIQNSNGLIHFLPRRMYENYLVCPEALSALMAELPDFRTPLVTPDQIKVWLATNGGSGKYGAPSPIQVLDKEWLEKVHAGKLLCDMFQELSEGRYIYRKTEYAVKLTSWLLKNQPDTIKELSDFLSGILASAQKTRTQ